MTNSDLNRQWYVCLKSYRKDAGRLTDPNGGSAWHNVEQYEIQRGQEERNDGEESKSSRKWSMSTALKKESVKAYRHDFSVIINYYASLFLLWFFRITWAWLCLTQWANGSIAMNLLMTGHARLHWRRLLTEGWWWSGWSWRRSQISRFSSIAVPHYKWSLGRRWRQKTTTYTLMPSRSHPSSSHG